MSVDEWGDVGMTLQVARERAGAGPDQQVANRCAEPRRHRVAVDRLVFGDVLEQRNLRPSEDAPARLRGRGKLRRALDEFFEFGLERLGEECDRALGVTIDGVAGDAGGSGDIHHRYCIDWLLGRELVDHLVQARACAALTGVHRVDCHRSSLVLAACEL
jgi:hypothetical protein